MITEFDFLEKCGVCFGEGYLVIWEQIGRTTVPCLRCKGTGKQEFERLELDLKGDEE